MTMMTDPETSAVPTLTVEKSFATPSINPTLRQQLMVLYLGTSALDANVLAWTRYDGTGRSRPTMGDSDESPYATGLDALIDGWRLIQMSQMASHPVGHEYDTAYLPYEFLFEKIVDIGAS